MNSEKHKLIPIKSFWGIKIPLILFFALTLFIIGYLFGMRRLEVAQQFAREMAIQEYPTIALVQSGVTFCYDRGNIYEARLIPTRRALMPVFRTKRVKEKK